MVNYPPEALNTRIVVSVDVVSNDSSELPSDDTRTSQDSYVEHSSSDRSDPGQQPGDVEQDLGVHPPMNMKKILRSMAKIAFRYILTPVLKFVSISAPGGMLVLDTRSRNSDHGGSSSSTNVSVSVVDGQLSLSNSEALAISRNEPPVTVSQTDNEPPVTVSTATQTDNEPPMADNRFYDRIVPILERRGPLELLLRGVISNISDIEDSEPNGDLRRSSDHTISLPSPDSCGSDGTGTISHGVETGPSAFLVHENPTFRSGLHGGEDTPLELQSPVSRQDPSEQPGTPSDPSTSIDASPYLEWTPGAEAEAEAEIVQDPSPNDHAETPRLEPAREPLGLGHTIRYRTPDDAALPDLDRVSFDKRIR